MKSSLLSVAATLALTGGMASAATVIDFDSGTLAGGVYTEDGFTFTSSSPGGTSLANNCPTGSPNSDCLQFNNNEVITVTYAGGAFDVDGFLFNGPGKGGDIVVSDGTTSTPLTESFNGNTLTPVTFTTEYDGIQSFSFQNVGRGSGRVDNLVLSVAAVPLPATGLLLLGGIGVIGAMRRRKAA